MQIPDINVVRLPGDAPDPKAVCAAYERAVEAAGGIDLAVLGLGPNGHLGFNEPPSDPRSPTRIVDLTEESVESNARYWGGRERVPRQALTAGMSVMLAARHILLVASGERKADILQRALQGPVTAAVPASYLQQAPHVTVIADHAAAAKLRPAS
jgi:glucosamine-6-phosphate deaminase